jgi:hypothetical protein
MAARHQKKAKAIDPFDPDQLRIPPELIATMKPAGAKPTRKTERSPTERYVQITETGAKGFEALGCSAAAALVWFEILYWVWEKGESTIALPNKRLAEVGVTRWAKYRAVNRLEQAGWIAVCRPRRKSMQISLLKPNCVIFKSK